MGEWISTTHGLPPAETPVLIMCNGAVRIGELRWECPGFEDTFKPYQYWDDPIDDGQCWEWFDVTHWMHIPPPPDAAEPQQENGTK